MDGSCPSDLFLFFFLKIDGAGEDGPRAIGEGISSPFPAVELQTATQVASQIRATDASIYKTSDYLSSQPPKTFSTTSVVEVFPYLDTFGGN